ncbi:rho guanine nucleotide exchange factor 37 isoform X2 [Xenopus tropicalis]|uniref:Rho guanine nucleotide exchange factor 37 isoform X2 n=1 Tax=Xenopus tropicalis TaxID=8364 RepID=A0A8J1J9Z0_XENTR|nr:rho guanine nucleotide exchange factor 37 isoform X2 [Xenopus tropicalis]
MSATRKLSIQHPTTQSRAFGKETSPTKDALPSASPASANVKPSILRLQEKLSLSNFYVDVAQNESHVGKAEECDMRMDSRRFCENSDPHNGHKYNLQPSVGNLSARTSIHTGNTTPSTSDLISTQDCSRSHVQDNPEHIYETLPFYAMADCSDGIYEDPDLLRDEETPPTGSFPRQNSAKNIPPYLSEDTNIIYDDAEGLGTTMLPELDELIQSEENYVEHLYYLTSTIRPILEKNGVDVKTLFCNMDEILQVAKLFLTELKKTECNGQYHLKQIGEMFLDFSKEMQNIYSTYCWEYERSLSLLEQYKESGTYQHIQELLHSELSGSKCREISFILVMPVQRITKYPLLLLSILKSCPPGDEAHATMQSAYSAMQEVNQNINEYKRCKEAGSKYHRLQQQSLIEKVSSLNTSTITKKYKRLSHRIMYEAGIIPKREDKAFDSLVEHFHILEAAVKLMKQNMASYMKNLEDFSTIQLDFFSLEIPDFSVFELQNFSQNLYPEYKRRLDLLVWQPLTKLSQCLKGPKNLIRKHTDKLLDYENLESKLQETGGKMTYEEEDIKNAYLGFHSRLLSELPGCIALSHQLLHQLLLTFIGLQKELAQAGWRAAESLASKTPNCKLAEVNFRRQAEDIISSSLAQLTELTKKFEQQMPSPAVQDHDPAIVLQVQKLIKRHGHQKEIYQVMSNINGSRDMDLTLHRFEIVAVLQKSDTKGNTHRWLVDTAGGTRGFVPCNKLQPYQSVNTPKPSQNFLGLSETVEKRRHSMNPLECPQPIYTESQNTTPIFQVIAGYGFTARSDYEATIIAGEHITVLEPHDKKGSPEWSLVEVRGQRGYVPSSYLVRVPVQNTYGWVVPT